MTLTKNKRTGAWETDLRNGPLPRIHLTLGTTTRADAQTLESALVLFRQEGDARLDALLRSRRKADGEGITVQQIARCVRDRQPFASLLPPPAPVAALTWPTVRAAADEYTGALGANPKKQAATATAARVQLESFAARFADTALDAVSLEDAAAWQDGLVQAVAANTARMAVARVVALYLWHERRERRLAQQAGRTPRALACPLDEDTRPTLVTRRERFLAREEAARLWAATPAALQALVGCGLLGGLRIGETLHLRPGADIDLARDMLVVQTRGKRGKPGYWRPKTGKRREVPITADLRPILARHLDALPPGTVYAFPARRRGDRPITERQTAAEFRVSVEAAGLVYGRDTAEGVTYHTLRHTFASWLVAADVNPYRVAKLLGNSLQMVESTYGHLAPTDNRKAVALLSGVLPLLTEAT